jgi:hypothetical protein
MRCSDPAVRAQRRSECEETCTKGHKLDCEALEVAHDLGDLMWRKPCTGCCPHGTRPTGMQALQDAAVERMNSPELDEQHYNNGT